MTVKKTSKKILAAACCALLCAAPLSAERVQTQLTADAMDYDMETGKFSARGNVTLVREGVTLTADSGEADINAQTARMWGHAHAFGAYRGEELDAKCAQVDADFGVPDGSYTMTGDVDAFFGTRVLRSETANLAGQDFGATAVTHFEDKNSGIVIACDTLTGDYDTVGVRNARGSGHVAAVQADETKITKLWCDLLVYSRDAGTTTGTGKPKMEVERLDGSGARHTTLESDRLLHSWKDNSITATGNARATQDGRKVSAKELVYYPETGKLEAHGTPRITVDLSAAGGSGQSKSSASGRRGAAQ